MFYKFRSQLKRRRFDRIARDVLATSPLGWSLDDGLVFVSQLRSRDVCMYLAAVKSIAGQFRAGRVLILDDGLNAADRATIAYHVPGTDFVPVASVDVGRCPRGGTWERLVTITRACQDAYVVQLDADLLALGAIMEVADLIQANRSFTLATAYTPDFTSRRSVARGIAAQVAGGDTHVQPVAEAAFDRLPAGFADRYIRGCSGFAGFAKKGCSFAELERFSVAMEGLLGAKWHGWGSEQVASNFLIANTPRPAALPLARYMNFRPGADIAEARLVHFMGTYRFANDVYRDRVRALIRSLHAGSMPSVSASAPEERPAGGGEPVVPERAIDVEVHGARG